MRFQLLALGSLPLLAALTACHSPSKTAAPVVMESPTVVSPKPAPPAPASLPTPLGSTDWTALFNGRDLTGWMRTDYAGGREPEVVDGRLLIGMSAMLASTLHLRRQYPELFKLKRTQSVAERLAAGEIVFEDEALDSADD